MTKPRSILSTMPFVQRWMPAVAVAAIILSAFTKSETISILWLIGLIAYGLLLNFFCKQTETDAEKLNQLAEHYYFAGYIATITGLGCVLYQLGMRVQSNQNLEELLTQDLLTLGGASVFCTIIGLIGMNVFRAQAFKQEQEARKLDAEQDQKRTQDVVQQIAKNFENFENRMKELESTRMEQFSRLMDASELSKVLTQLVGEIQGGAKGLEDLRKVSKSAFGTIGHLEQKLTGMDGALQGIAEGSGKVQQNFASIAQQSDRIETLASHLESASNSLKTLGEDGKSSVQELRDQFDLLSEIISQTNKETQSWKEKTSTAHQQMDDFCAAFSNLCFKLQKSAETEIGDFCAAFENACHKLNNSLKTAEDFVQKLSESASQTAHFSQSLESVTAQTAEHRQAFESFKTDLQQTANALTQSVQELLAQFKTLGEQMTTASQETQDWKEQTSAAYQQMDDFREAFSKICFQLQNSANKEISDFCAAFENASLILQNSLKTAQDFTQKLSDGATQTAHFSQSLESATAQTAEHRQAFQSFKTDLQQTATALTQNIQELLKQFKSLGEEMTGASQKTQTWKNQTNETSQEIQRFGEIFQTTCQQLKQASETVIRYADNLQEKLNDPNWNSKMAGNFIDDFAQRINDFAKKISESLAEMPNLSKSLEETRDRTNSINKELEKLRKMIEEIPEQIKEQKGFWQSLSGWFVGRK